MKRMFEAKKEMSNAGSCEKFGGFGKTPWVKAKATTSTPMNQSKITPVEYAAASVGYDDGGIEIRVRNSCGMFPPLKGDTLFTA